MRAFSAAGARTVRIAHDSPGRLRLRLPGGADAEAVAAHVRDLPGVRQAAWSPRTRGLLILYSGEATPGHIVESAAKHAGAVVESPAPARPGPESPSLSAAVVTATGEVDRAVRSATRGALRL